MKKYFKNTGLKRLSCSLLGNVLIGIGVAFYKHAALGNDPFSAMTLSLSALTPLNYGTFLLIFNLCLFLFQFICGKKYIGIGTLINWTLLGYVADLCMYLDQRFLTIPDTFLIRVIIMAFGILITAMGVSLYQTSDSGVSPYDYIAIGLSEKTPLPYFFCRIICDGSAVLVTLLAGGILGIGTLLTVLFLGPLIQILTKSVSSKIID